MIVRPNDPRPLPSETSLRVIMRGLREIMSEGGEGQDKLDRIVRQIAGVMIADVCSIYLKRQDGSLELFATEGLNPSAVHKTRMKRGEGLVGRCSELGVTVNEPEASSHPAFSYRPETSEEIYHSLLAVPISRSGQVLGVLVIQNRTPKEYSDEDVEVLQATAMVVAENLVSGAVAGTGAALEGSLSQPMVIEGEPLSEGIALGHVVLHEPRIVVTHLLSDNPVAEIERLELALAKLQANIDEMFEHEHLSAIGEHRDVLEAYRMFAHDKGWHRRLREAVEGGLTAEAAVERVQNAMRTRMLKQHDTYWRERQRDLDDLSDRLLRVLAGRLKSSEDGSLPPEVILIARTMGPAELLDYDRSRLRGLVVEDGSSQSHVAVVAKALGIAAVGQAAGIVDRVAAGDAAIIDAVTGEVHLRPTNEVIAAYSDKVRFRARKQKRYQSLRGRPAVTKDGIRIALLMNAGLLVDMSHLIESGADGVGLYRTELQFMLSDAFPRLDRQTQLYRSVIEEAEGKPVVFRSLDIGGDKVLPYLRQPKEENPAMGWRAIRMALDRPELFRLQIRALLKAAAGRELRVMIPMVSAPYELGAIRALIEREKAFLTKHGHQLPSSMLVGAMFEVPALLFDLDAFLTRVDFVSIGSNDLMQFMFAADRTNARVASRFDVLTAAPLRALRMLIKAAKKHKVPLTLCGEMAGSPLEAMTLIALGLRSLSMAPASIGPIKTMILSLDAEKATTYVEELLKEDAKDLRMSLQQFAEKEGVAIDG
ncbi:PTSINtr with GAF domain, PtsP [Hyphomicrobium denitrificans 1NES1]|uniref:phosphoenolpyruvate--protein phosphotransferase n=1 Tax=Hyphomicrobium denitrificans 1NES1 TaxID=670307 RepID=N0BHX0_9HYPH|nr:phosphoenolpyruvate--protein phosphotransferase [Hyphomicrobium denitrificans]AGK60011.1 PTSINtr with GAF domain, PtsP [Hyphomicrobium denitrificans 1NES1]